MTVVVDEAVVDAIFARLDSCQLPGAAVGIAVNGKTVYRKAFGLANMELSVALSPAMRMRIGSTTKHFTCLAYLLLCEQRLAGLDDGIGKFLPGLHPVARDVTVRQLMGHVSGLRDAVEWSWIFSGTGPAISSAALVSLYRDIDTVNFAPGTSWSYNNGGYALLTAAIERITGQPLEEVLRERIFEPVGMRDTLLRRFDTDFVPNSATLHMTGGAAGSFEKAYLGAALAGEGGIVSTVDDMLRWLAHMDHPVVGTAATWEALRAPWVLANGTSTGYGLGLITERYRKVETISHAGGVMGGNSQMLKVPAAGLDIVVLVNRHDVLGMFLVNEVLDACFAEVESPRTPQALVAGTYRSPGTDRVVALYVKEGRQYACIDGFDVPVVLQDDGSLWPAAGYRTMKQTLRMLRDDVLLFSDFGNIDELVRVTGGHTRDIRARYLADSAAVDASIEDSSDGLQLVTTGPFGSARFLLEPLAQDVWRARSRSPMAWGGMLSFDASSGDFKFGTARTRGLRFRRC